MNKIKNTSKLIIGFILGAIIFGGLTGMLAYAINATDVSFTPSDNSWEVENVKAALDDLYKVADKYNLDGKTLVGRILADNVVNIGAMGYDAIPENGSGGLYLTTNTDDDSGVYYYRGKVDNNWVRFGSDGNGTCYYWRIIRTNTESEGGGVRLLYSGASTDCSGSVPVMTDSYIKRTYYATEDGKYNNMSYIGYMYTLGEQFGHSVSSNAKQIIDDWYSTKGLSNYSAYINEDAVYCNDRSTTNGQTWAKTAPGFSYDILYRTGRWYINGDWTELDSSLINPTLKCTNSEDKFSKGTTGGGNGYLSNPIAMMTSDEIIYAGGKFESNSYSWYSYASDNISSAVGDNGWITMSPALWNGYNATIISVKPNEENLRILGVDNIRYATMIRPVVSLKANVEVESGDGTAANPYTIKEI